MTTNVGTVTDAIVFFLTKAKPIVHNFLVNLYGDAWWDKAVLSKVGSKVGGYDLTKIRKDYLKSIDFYLLIKILRCNRLELYGKKSKQGHILDNRFFDLVNQLNDIRNYGNAHFGEDISSSQRNDMIYIINEVLYYLDSRFAYNENEKLDFSEINVTDDILKKNYNLIVVKNNRTKSKIITEADITTWVKKDGRYGCYYDNIKISDNVKISADKSIYPLFDLEEYSGKVRRSYGDGSYYEGYVLLGFRHGIGKMVDKDGVSYNTGLYYNDNFIGNIIKGIDNAENIKENEVYDVIINCKGDVYEGTICNGALNGEGIMKYTSGLSKQGIFCNNEFLGDVITFDNLSYDLSKLFNYSGKLSIVNDHSTYSGDWNKGVMEGSGKLECINNYTYRGEFHNNVPDGRGIMSFVNGDVYRGTFKNGVFHGEGRYEFSDGSVFEGSFMFGLRSGPGLFKHNNGKIKGQWNHGVLDGNCTFSLDNIEVSCVAQNNTCNFKTKLSNPMSDFILTSGFRIHYVFEKNNSNVKSENKKYNIKYVKKDSVASSSPFAESSINWNEISW